MASQNILLKGIPYWPTVCLLEEKNMTDGLEQSFLAVRYPLISMSSRYFLVRKLSETIAVAQSKPNGAEHKI